MGITDLFRPNWKHSDVGVRLKAVRAMDADDLTLLVQIAETDSDRGVRELAVSKIDDADALDALAAGCGDEVLAGQATERADSLRISLILGSDDLGQAETALEKICDDVALADIVKRANLQEVRRAALDRLSDERALADVVRTSNDRALCGELLERIEDPSILRGIAMQDRRRDVAQAALGRVDDPDDLRAIQQSAKIKAVRKRAKKLLDAQSQPDEGARQKALAQKKLHAQMVQLCRTVEKLSGSTHWVETAEHIAQATRQWEELKAQRDEEDPKLERRFKAARVGFETRRKQAEANAAEHQWVQAAHREEVERRAALCEQILALEGEDVDDRLTALQEQWEAMGPAPDDIRDAVEKRYAAALRQRRKRTEAPAKAPAEPRDVGPEFEALLAAAEQAAGNKKLNAAHKRLAPIVRDWRKLERVGRPPEELAERFAALQEKLREREREHRAAQEQKKQENQAWIEGLIKRLGEARTSKDLRPVDRLLKDAKRTLKKPGPLPSKEVWKELRPQIDEAQKALHDHLLELREADDWKRWSNTPKLQELCKRAEALAEVEDLAAIAQELRKVQAEWKKVGPVTRGKGDEQWERFKKACDEAYARCEGYFAEQAEARKENLANKEALCEQAEALADSTDFKETAEQLKELQARWKAIGPVPRKKSDAVWKRFRRACDQFFDRRKEHFKVQDEARKENLTAKEALCEQAEALSTSQEWDETANQLKGLQARWKAIGPVPRRSSDAIWERFRSACDHFFERRKSHADEGRSANLKQKNELCEALEKLAERRDATGDEKAEQVLAAWSEWKTIGPIPLGEDEPTQARLDAVTSKIVEAHPAAFKGSPLDPEANARRKAELCLQAEVLAAAEVDKRKGARIKLGEQDVEDMAARLKEALASNAFSQETKAEEEQRIVEQVRSLRKAWARSGPVPGEQGRTLQERFRKACDEALGPRKK